LNKMKRGRLKNLQKIYLSSAYKQRGIK